ncbi:MAG: sulfatase [Myxococcota bacterium]|nr:sulfatase [Myxococcota bacterium]
MGRWGWIAGGAVVLAGAAAVLGGCAPAGPPPARPNVLLVTLDTTRADRLGAYGYARPTTPRLDELARESVVFERAYAPSTWTLPSHASLFTGKLPSSHGARYDPEGPLVLGSALDGPDAWSRIRARGLSRGEVTLAGLLGEAGYRTGAVVAGPWMKRIFGLDAGFEHYDDAGIGSLNGRAAGSVTDAALDWLARDDERPFFLFLNYYDPHTPLMPPWDSVLQVVPRDERPRGRARTRTELSGLYDAEVHYTDQELGRLLDALRASGRWDDTWIAVTADHGELQGEHGETGHGKSLYEPELRVPLLVKPARGGPSPGRSRELVQLTDVFSMILARVGLVPPAGTAAPGDDVPVLAEVHPLPQFAKRGSWRALIEGDHKYLESSRGERLLFDVVRDADETENLLPREPERARAMAARLADALAALPAPPASDGTEREVDEETRRALESLGYLE